MILGPTLPMANMGHPLNQGLATWLMRHQSQGGGPLMQDVSARGRYGVLNGMDGGDWTAVGNTPALNLDGAMGTYIQLPTIFASAVYSIQIAFTPTGSMVGYYSLFSCYTSNGDAAEIFIQSENGAGSLAGGNYDGWARAATVLTAGTRYVIGLTSNGSVTQLYLNGLPVGSAGTAGFSTFTPSTRIGIRSDGSFPCPGRLEACIVHARALPAPEMAEWASQWRRGFPDTLVRQRRYARGAAATKARPPFVNRCWNFWKTKV